MEKLRVLLVDDDKDDREFFANAVESLDMNVDKKEVTNGKECLDFLKENRDNQVDLIFLDLNMPVMDGLECLEKIKANPDYRDVIIAIYSTSSSERDIDQAFIRGANIYINKPTNYKELVETLKQVIETNCTYKTNSFSREHFLLKI